MKLLTSANAIVKRGPILSVCIAWTLFSSHFVVVFVWFFFLFFFSLFCVYRFRGRSVICLVHVCVCVRKLSIYFSHFFFFLLCWHWNCAKPDCMTCKRANFESAILSLTETIWSTDSNAYIHTYSKWVKKEKEVIVLWAKQKHIISCSCCCFYFRCCSIYFCLFWIGQKRAEKFRLLQSSMSIGFKPKYKTF